MTFLPEYGAPFIFANFNGTSGDVDVITHVRIPHRSRISVPEIYPGIYIGQLIQPKAFSPSFMHLGRGCDYP